MFSRGRFAPWSLARGCIASNLRALTASDAPAEETTFRVWSVLKLGVNSRELHEAIGLVVERRWSTRVVEQLHGACASLHKLHRERGVVSLTARAMVAKMKQLLGRDDLEK